MSSSKTGLAFLSDWNGKYNNRKMDHLVCFMPGALALGAYTGTLDNSVVKYDCFILLVKLLIAITLLRSLRVSTYYVFLSSHFSFSMHSRSKWSTLETGSERLVCGQGAHVHLP